MNRRSKLFVLCAAILIAYGCGGDTTQEQDNDWDLSDDAGFSDTDDNQDTTEVLPTGVVPEAFIGQTWYGVFRVTDDPAISGIYMGVEFVDEDNITLHGPETRQGNWSILENEDIHLYDIEPAEQGGAPEQWIMQPDLDGDEVIGLEMPIPASHIPPYRLRLEPHGEADIAYAELEGRWQSSEAVTNEEGNSFYLATRFNDNEFIEYGIVAQNNNFVGFTNGAGFTQTFATGQTFWAMIPGSTTEGAPIAGEVRAEGDDYRLYFFAETFHFEQDDDNDPGDGSGSDGEDDADNGAEPESELIVVEFERVDQFSSNP